MIIDFHTHIFPDRVNIFAIRNLEEKSGYIAKFDGSVNGLKKDMLKNNIDISVAMPVVTNVKNTISINNFAIMVNNQNDNIISFGGIHPEDENYKEELQRLKQNGIKGIKIHPVYQNCFINDERYVNIINEAFKLGLIVLTHAGLDPGYPGHMESSLEHILNLLNKIDEGVLVLAHMGALDEWNDVLEKLAGKNVYFDTAMCFGNLITRDGKKIDLINRDLLIQLINKHGADKILLGTDNPWMESSDMVNYLNNLPISEDDKEKILYKNALRILGEVDKNG